MNLHKRLLTGLLIALTFFFSHSAFADSPEAVVNDAMSQMDRMVDALLTVKDKASAETAVKDLMGVTEELKKIAVRAKTVGQPTAEQKEQLMAKMQAKTAEMKTRLAAGKEQLAKAGVEAAAVLGKGMMEFGKAMQEVGQAFQAADKK